MLLQVCRCDDHKIVQVYDNETSNCVQLFELALARAVILYTFQTEICKILRVWFVDGQ